ncbi:hypothetical protein [Lacticaseibacillus parakribbianus]|uniref:hypothetical protein n=1 Tax=Lacticaseibacillus parakribbianus TaxID=2970927 RepID=UPI0021CB2A33|nr:hypothetical protein [Lacticaseibacillus parakribbianus]
MTTQGDTEARQLIKQGVTTMWRLGAKVSADKFQAVDKDTGELPTCFKKIESGKYIGLWASSYGEVMTPQGHIISSANINNAGYHTVTFRLNGRLTTTTIGRLVATAWLDNPNNLSDVKHKGLLTDDRAENLYWVANTRDGNHKPVQVSVIDVKTGDIMRDFASISAAAKACKASTTAVSGALTSHKPVNGYKFIYTQSISKAKGLIK